MRHLTDDGIVDGQGFRIYHQPFIMEGFAWRRITEHHKDGRVTFYFERSLSKMDVVLPFGVGIEISEDDYCYMALQYQQRNEFILAHDKIDEVLSTCHRDR